MKAILIDPNKQTIELVESTGKLDDIYRLTECRMIEMPIQYKNGDVMYCNEEGWLEWSEQNKQCGFKFPDWNYPILGKAIIFGSTRNGAETTCKSKVSDFSNIIWVDAEDMKKFGESIGIIY